MLVVLVLYNYVMIKSLGKIKVINRVITENIVFLDQVLMYNLNQKYREIRETIPCQGIRRNPKQWNCETFQREVNKTSDRDLNYKVGLI